MVQPHFTSSPLFSRVSHSLSLSTSKPPLCLSWTLKEVVSQAIISNNPPSVVSHPSASLPKSKSAFHEQNTPYSTESISRQAPPEVSQPTRPLTHTHTHTPGRLLVRSHQGSSACQTGPRSARPTRAAHCHVLAILPFARKAHPNSSGSCATSLSL